VAIYAGNIDQSKVGSKGLVVRRCRFEDVGVGIMAAVGSCRHFYIADNVFTGRYRVWDYVQPAQGGSWTAVWIAGQGHDICYNRVTHFWDGIDVSGSGGGITLPREFHNVAIDIYNNDISRSADDFIEADGAVHNVRVFENRCLNAMTCGLSAQPAHGGPVYFLRNIVYNLPRYGIAFKFKAWTSGLLVYHNTVFGYTNTNLLMHNAHFRNNLMFSAADSKGNLRSSMRMVGFATPSIYSTSDYNGYGPFDVWYTYKSLEELTKNTGYEEHGRMVDSGIFRSAQEPRSPPWVYAPQDVDLRLQPGSAAVDAGLHLPTVNDGFRGEAPDLGAYELGGAVPIYGPRIERE